jgi:hypothetical protein
MKEIKSTWIMLVYYLNWDRREPNGRVCILPRLARLRPKVLRNGPSFEITLSSEKKSTRNDPGPSLVRHIVLSTET